MNFLDLEAYLGGEFLHPGGQTVTQILLKELHLPPGSLALELGCGTGATASVMARQFGTRVIGLDQSPAMLNAAQTRRRKERLCEFVQCVQADAARTLPFPDAVFDAVYAESVIALLDVEPVIAECVRVLQPGGRLALIERIWKPHLPQALVDEINAASRRAFGIPAGSSQPFDRADWVQLLQQVGLVEIRALPVDALLPPQRPGFHLRRRLSRGRRYLARPEILWHSLWFKVMIRRHKELWSHMESYLFLAQKRET